MSAINTPASATQSAGAAGTALHAGAAASGGLAAAIAMAISQIIGWFFGTDHVVEALVYGASVSAVAFGATYAGVFFAGLAMKNRRR